MSSPFPGPLDPRGIRIWATGPAADRGISDVELERVRKEILRKKVEGEQKGGEKKEKLPVSQKQEQEQEQEQTKREEGEKQELNVCQKQGLELEQEQQGQERGQEQSPRPPPIQEESASKEPVESLTQSDSSIKTVEERTRDWAPIHGGRKKRPRPDVTWPKHLLSRMLIIKSAPKQFESESSVIVYWMSCTPRIRHNFALEAAVLLSRDLGIPLVTLSYTGSTSNHKADRLREAALREARQSLKEMNIPHIHYRGKDIVVMVRELNQLREIHTIFVDDDPSPSAVLERCALCAELKAAGVIALESNCISNLRAFLLTNSSRPVSQPSFVKECFLSSLDSFSFQPHSNSSPTGAEAIISATFPCKPLPNDLQVPLLQLQCKYDFAPGSSLELESGEVPLGGERGAEKALKILAEGEINAGELEQELDGRGVYGRLLPLLRLGTLSPFLLFGGPLGLVHEVRCCISNREYFLYRCAFETSFRMKHLPNVLPPAPDALNWTTSRYVDMLPGWLHEELTAAEGAVQRSISLEDLTENQTRNKLFNAIRDTLKSSGILHPTAHRFWGQTAVEMCEAGYRESIESCLRMILEYGIGARTSPDSAMWFLADAFLSFHPRIPSKVAESKSSRRRLGRLPAPDIRAEISVRFGSTQCFQDFYSKGVVSSS